MPVHSMESWSHGDFFKHHLPSQVCRLLLNKVRRVKKEGDCSLFVRRVQTRDQGEYMCIYYDPQPGWLELSNKLETKVKRVFLVVINGSSDTADNS